jgi:hypothetical protein
MDPTLETAFFRAKSSLLLNSPGEIRHWSDMQTVAAHCTVIFRLVVVFHPGSGMDADTALQVPTTLRLAAALERKRR